METDYQLIKAKDYETRYSACERILAQNGITKGLATASIAAYIAISSLDPNNPTAKEFQKFEKAIGLIQNYIAKHAKKVDYSQYNQTELNDILRAITESYSEAVNGQLVKILLDLGATWDTRDKWGCTAFFRAMHLYKFSTLKVFIAHGADINDTYFDENSEYFDSVWLRSVAWAAAKEVKYMLEQGADIKAVNSENRNALHQQCETNRALEALEYLVEAGVDINLQDKHLKTPLHLLCRLRSDMPEEVAYLLEKGANPNLKDHVGQTVLHKAVWVWQAKRETVEVLLKYGVDINAQDEDGNTALHIAINRENKAIVKTLLKYKPVVLLVNKEGETAYQLAIRKGHVGLASLINSNAEEDYKNQPEFQEIKEIKEQIIAKLIAGKYYYTSDKEGYTKFLYRDGEYVDERYEEGQTPPVVYKLKTATEALAWFYNRFKWKSWHNKSELNIYKAVLDAIR